MHHVLVLPAQHFKVIKELKDHIYYRIIKTSDNNNTRHAIHKRWTMMKSTWSYNVPLWLVSAYNLSTHVLTR